MTNVLEKIKVSSVILLSIAIIIAAFSYSNSPKSLGGVTRGSEYHAVVATSATTAKSNETVRTVPSTLGSVVITITGTAPLTIYNATTTNVNLRALATSSLEVLAYFGASPTVGTYTYDVVATQGILAVFGTGTVASSTLTWR